MDKLNQFFFKRKPQPQAYMLLADIFRANNFLIPPHIIKILKKISKTTVTDHLQFSKLIQFRGLYLSTLKQFKNFFFFLQNLQKDLIFTTLKLPIFGLNFFKLTKRERGIFKVKVKYGVRWVFLNLSQRRKWLLLRLVQELRFLPDSRFRERLDFFFYALLHRTNDLFFPPFYRTSIPVLLRKYRKNLLRYLSPRKRVWNYNKFEIISKKELKKNKLK